MAQRKSLVRPCDAVKRPRPKPNELLHRFPPVRSRQREKYRLRWLRYDGSHFGKVRIKPKQDDAIAKATAKLLRELGIKRPSLSIYSLWHTFETSLAGAVSERSAGVL